MPNYPLAVLSFLLPAAAASLHAGCLPEPFSASVSSIPYAQALAENPDAAAVRFDRALGGSAIVFDAKAGAPVAIPQLELTLAGCATLAPSAAPAAAAVPTSTASQAMSTADLNGDGVLDAVVADAHANVTVYLGADGQSFQPGVDYPAGAAPASLLLIDVNGDGKLDLVVANAGAGPKDPGGVSVLLGNGDGTFQNAASYLAGAGPNSVAVGDFNGDGQIDLAVANTGQGAAGSVSILLGLGDGTFRAAANYPAGTAPWSIVAGDWNGDGVPDLGVANFRSGDVAVLAGKGDGSFGPAVKIAVGDGPSYLGTADLNQDGVADLVVLHAPHSALSVLLGDGKGGFQRAGAYLAAQSPRTFQFLSWRDGGIVDLMTAGAGGLSLYEGNGDGTLAAPALYFTGGFPQAVAVADFNMDGSPDLVEAGDASVSLLLARGQGAFAAPAAVKIPLLNGDQPFYAGVAAGDFNGDGIPDLVVADSDDSRLITLLGVGDGTFTPAASVTLGAAPTFIATGDFNRDGHLDVAVADSSFGVVWLLLGNGKGQLQAPRGLPIQNAQSIVVGDFNGDGAPDLAVVNGGDPAGGSGNVSVLLGNGDGTFKPAAIYPAGASPTWIAAADFNGDGNLDLAVATSDGVSSSIAVLLGDGGGKFQSAIATPVSDGISAIVARDLDGDGKPDLAVAHCCGPLGGMAMLSGNGDGTFGPETAFAGGDSPAAIAVADLDGDGRPDLAVAAGAQAQQGTLTILLNNLPLLPPPAP